jgi:hypothetical protein
LEFPESSVSEHFDLSGYSRGRGMRIKTLLLREGLVVSGTQRSERGGRPREILSLTEKGREFLKTEGGRRGEV